MIDIDLLLALGGAFKRIPKGTTIFREGTPCFFYYQIESGRVRWSNIDEEGKEFIQTIHEDGESFGELPLFDDEPYAATATAEVDTVVIRLRKPVFIQLMKENQDLH